MFYIHKSQLKLSINEPEYGDEGHVAFETVKPQLKRPSMYRVIMMNDDYTPMEFVVEILQSFFNKDLEEAHQIMLTVHHHGSAVCAIYTRDLAETKAALVNQYARDNQHPLMCEIAPAED